MRSVLSFMAWLGGWYRAQSRRVQIIVGSVAVLLVCGMCGGIVDHFPGNTTIDAQSSLVPATAVATATATIAIHLSPTATPQPTVTPKPLNIAITYVSVVPSTYAHVSVQTSAGADVSMVARYDCSGTLDTPADKTADATGLVEFVFKPNTNCSGNVHVITSAKLGSASGMVQGDYQSS